MTRMRAVQVTSPNGPFELVERDIPEPPARHVRVKVQACGVCHSDSFTKMGAFPSIHFPRVPGHEVVGTIDAIGAEVPGCNPASGLASAGMAVIAVTVSPAGAVISLPAGMVRSRESHTTAATPIT